jgi:hypothetical protein
MAAGAKAHMRHACSCQKEDTKEDERKIPWVVGVGDGCQGCDGYSGRGQRVPAPRSVDERAGRGDGNDRFHGRRCRSLRDENEAWRGEKKCALELLIDPTGMSTLDSILECELRLSADVSDGGC